MAILDRIDKNGTKYYHTNTCNACGGTGYRPEYAYNEGGRCFVCGGTGSKYHAWKEYTPEYSAKLAARRLAKTRAHAEERNREYFQSIGFSAEGTAWFVIGNSYEIKDQLKADGARWSPAMGWHFAEQPANYNCFKVESSEIGEINEVTGWFELYDAPFLARIFEQKQSEHAPKTESQWVGEIGQKLEIPVKLVKVSYYKTNFSYWGEDHYIYKFVDEAGNTLVWDTSSFPEVEEGHSYLLKGTVKKQDEYKGDKQTVLVRCKVTEA